MTGWAGKHNGKINLNTLQADLSIQLTNTRDTTSLVAETLTSIEVGGKVGSRTHLSNLAVAFRWDSVRVQACGLNNEPGAICGKEQRDFVA